MTIKQVKCYLREIILEEVIKRNSAPSSYLKGDSQKSETQGIFQDLNCILKHFKEIPRQLFKYRECNENNFNALENQEVWLSSAENFVDPYDCRLPFSIKELPNKKINKLMKWFVFTDYIVGYNRENLKKYNAVTPQEARKIMFSRCYNDELYPRGREIVKFIKKNYSREEHDDMAQKFLVFDQCISRRGRGARLREWFRNDAEIGCQETIELHRKNEYACSLTETNDNPKMWEEYADGYKGYCICFDFSKGIRKDLLNSSGHVAALKAIFPIFYRKKRPKFDSFKFLIKQYQQDFYEEEGEFWEPATSEILSLQMLFKHPMYSNEKEWRILVGGEVPGLFWFPFFSSLYLGKDISNENKERLLEIAKKLNLSVYQQKVNVDGFTYELIQDKKVEEVLWEWGIYIGHKYLF